MHTGHGLREEVPQGSRGTGRPGTRDVRFPEAESWDTSEGSALEDEGK